MIYPINYIAITQTQTSKHNGVDFGFYSQNHHHQPIYAIADGTVIYKKVQKSGGKVIHIKHNGVISEYGHMDSWTVNIGDKVIKGEQIGTMGSTGNVTGEHLHFGLCKGNKITYTKKDKWLNPLKYLCKMNYQTCNTKSKKYIKYNSKKAITDLWIHNKKDFDKSSRVFSLDKNESIEYYGSSGKYAIVNDLFDKMYCSVIYLK